MSLMVNCSLVDVEVIILGKCIAVVSPFHQLTAQTCFYYSLLKINLTTVAEHPD